MAWSTSSDVSIRYELSGQGSRGLILVHELGGSLESWDSVVPLLERDFQILRWDQRGSGLSEKVRAPFAFGDHARDLEALVQAVELEPPYRIAGVAMGAAIALDFAQRRPNDVAGMVLCAPATRVSPERRLYLANRAERAVREGMRAVTDGTLARSFPASVIRDRVTYDAYRARFLSNDPVCYALANGAFAAADIETAIDALRCRCLVLAGSHDELRPPDEVKALSMRLQNAEFAVIDSGHLMPVQAPQAVAKNLIGFFDGDERG